LRHRRNIAVGGVFMNRTIFAVRGRDEKTSGQPMANVAVRMAVGTGGRNLIFMPVPAVR
jgi:hypothetical protein